MDFILHETKEYGAVISKSYVTVTRLTAQTIKLIYNTNNRFHVQCNILEDTQQNYPLSLESTEGR